jgi:hypothetical protein
MQNIHGKEIDLLRTTVKVPGKRLPRATPATAPGTSPRANGLAMERSNTQLTGGTGEAVAVVGLVESSGSMGGQSVHWLRETGVRPICFSACQPGHQSYKCAHQPVPHLRIL